MASRWRTPSGSSIVEPSLGVQFVGPLVNLLKNHNVFPYVLVSTYRVFNQSCRFVGAAIRPISLYFHSDKAASDMWRAQSETVDFESTRTDFASNQTATFVHTRIIEVRNGRGSNGRLFRLPSERFNEINKFRTSRSGFILTPACHDQRIDQAPGLFLIFS